MNNLNAITNYLQTEKVSLCALPTPLLYLPGLSRIWQRDIFCKRDDLSGPAFGGNKNRKLEYLLHDAQKKEADTIITSGSVQSNHCRQTAGLAAMLGLECHLLLGGAVPNQSQANLLLDLLFGATIHWTGKQRKGETEKALLQKLIDAGKRPYLVPYGGSNGRGALGYTSAFLELQGQFRSQKIFPGSIVLASSSGATYAGLLAGKLVTGDTIEIFGIEIDPDQKSDDQTRHIHSLISETLSLLGVSTKVDSGNPPPVHLYGELKEAGYAVVTEEEKQVILQTARADALLLDPVYTARAMLGLHRLLTKKLLPEGPVLFWHTGGQPALFDQNLFSISPPG